MLSRSFSHIFMIHSIIFSALFFLCIRLAKITED
uniref:Uncharacterized protein n=1 Tax=Arundo donax TaxID=35708 RepID=A0A0A9F2R1_ARUDO